MLRELAQAVIGPLKRGLHSLNNVSEMLFSMNAHIVLPGCQTFRDIRREIENMKQEMEKSEQAATKELQLLDKETECLTAQQSHLAEQKKQKECELKGLQKQLESHRSCLKSYSEALETHRRNLQTAEDTKHSMRQRRNRAETVTNAGIGVLAIPIFGWIAGQKINLEMLQCYIFKILCN